MLRNKKHLYHKIVMALVALTVAISGFGFSTGAALAASAPIAASQLDDDEVCVQHHIVQRGETLARIGRLYGIGWQELARINDLDNPSVIYTGQRLCVEIETTVPQPPANRGFSFDVTHVARNKNVTIKVFNTPANTLLDVFMDERGTTGVDGFRVDTINTGKGGSFSVSFDIPTALRNEARLVIRLEARNTGRFYYVTFTNATGSGSGSNQGGSDTVQPGDVGERLDSISKRLRSGRTVDLYRGNQGVYMPASSYNGTVTMTRLDLNDTRRLEFITRGMDVQVNADNAREDGKVRGLVNVYFNLDEDSRQLWRDGDLSIYRYNPVQKVWEKCPTSLVENKNRPFGRLTCPISNFGIYGMAAAG